MVPVGTTGPTGTHRLSAKPQTGLLIGHHSPVLKGILLNRVPAGKVGELLLEKHCSPVASLRLAKQSGNLITNPQHPVLIHTETIAFISSRYFSLDHKRKGSLGPLKSPKTFGQCNIHGEKKKDA